MSDDLPKRFDAAAAETAIYERWHAAGCFRATPDERPPEQRYTIMMPPPNVTGALHMGHSFYTLQDLLVRWHRMRGDNTLWLPGTDHAGIATQATVERRIREKEGKTRYDLGREELVRRIWEWRKANGDRILFQLRKLGASADWDRTRFTLDEMCSKAVREFFFRMFEDGLIVRKKRLVNWDTFLKTAVADDEVYYTTLQGKFYELKYPLVGGGENGVPAHVVVATTRPETMLGDTAVAVHPEPAQAFDKAEAKLKEALEKADAKEKAGLEEQLAALAERRATKLPALEQLAALAAAGQLVELPLVGRKIPLVGDVWAKPELGTGCVKITPAHDPNDYEVGVRQKLPMVNIMHTDGTVNDNGKGSFRGRDFDYSGLRFEEAREKVVADLAGLGLLGTVVDKEIEMPLSDRSKTPIEPYLSDQWFVRMGDLEEELELGRGTPHAFKAPGMAQAAMDAVSDGRVQFFPERYAQTYLSWLSEKRDWCISRQLWWGHRIPVWTSADVAAKLADEDDLWSRKPADRARLCALLGIGEERLEGLAWNWDAEVGRFAMTCRDDLDSCPLSGGALERDPDVLDTWFSSGLWPFSTLGWPDKTPDLDYYYPTGTLVTAREIITLWVVRMVLSGLYTQGRVPFRHVFIHAVLQDGAGKKMSKSLGNGIDPVDIIEAYGTDAMRYVLCDMTTGTQDIRLPVSAICPACGHHNDLTGQTSWVYDKQITCSECGQEIHRDDAKTTSDKFVLGKNFTTKLWNAVRFGLLNLSGDDDSTAPCEPRELAALPVEDRWVLSQLSRCVRAVNESLAAYEISRVVDAIRGFFWDQLCDWYLELVKPRIRDGRQAGAARQILAFCLDQVLRMLHPIMPFVTETLWSSLGKRAPERGLPGIAPLTVTEQLIVAPFPPAEGYPAFEDAATEELFARLVQVVRAVRDVRGKRGISPKQELAVSIAPMEGGEELFARLPEGREVLVHSARLGELELAAEASPRSGTATLTVGLLTVLVHDVVDLAAERKRLDKALTQASKRLEGCRRKLANPGFRSKAKPEVIAREEEREAKLQAEVASLQSAVAELEAQGG